MSEAQRPIFFTSMPKCGKNLVYSFCFALGMQRYAWGDAPSLLHRAYFARYSDKRNYSFPEAGAPSPEELEAAWLDMEQRIATLPRDAIAHNHFLPDDRLAGALLQTGTPTIFVTRDPRDVLLSMLNFARQRQLPTHVHELLRDLDDETALMFLLDGGGVLTPFAEYFVAYAGWLTTPGVITLRFEDMVGPEGGGDADRQIEVCRLLTYLAGLTPSEEEFSAAVGKMFNVKAGTYFRGQIGAWREGFSPLVQKYYDRCAGGLAERWGYDE